MTATCGVSEPAVLPLTRAGAAFRPSAWEGCRQTLAIDRALNIFDHQVLLHFPHDAVAFPTW